MKFYFGLLAVLLMMISCAKEEETEDGAGSIPDTFTKEIKVFNIPVLGTANVTDAKMLHAAKIMAQYLDSDEDGVANNTQVTDHMAENNVYMVITKDEAELNEQDFGNWPGNGDGVVTLIADEMKLTTDYANDGFDPSIEEILHLITSNGYAKVYPDNLGEKTGTDIADAMDTARGGQHTSIPSSYPGTAWFTYSDSSCDYKCQVTEYTYWLITTYIGIQNYNGRDTEIADEWDHTTQADLTGGDENTNGVPVITNSTYGLPTAAPDLTYSGKDFTVQSR